MGTVADKIRKAFKNMENEESHKGKATINILKRKTSTDASPEGSWQQKELYPTRFKGATSTFEHDNGKSTFLLQCYDSPHPPLFSS